MRSVQRNSYILPFATRRPAYAMARGGQEVGPLRRIELHQVEHDEIRSLRERLLEMIMDNEQRRKVARFRLVN